MENQNKVRADLRQLKPFFIVAFVGIIYHLRIRPMAGDDVFFSQATSELGLWNYLIQRYETWTSRFVIEFLLVWIIKYPILWRLIDLALFISFSRFMYICLYKADKIVYNCYIVLLRDAVVIFYFKAVKCPLIQ